jgi:hypothetical protein
MIAAQHRLPEMWRSLKQLQQLVEQMESRQESQPAGPQAA